MRRSLVAKNIAGAIAKKSPTAQRPPPPWWADLWRLAKEIAANDDGAELYLRGRPIWAQAMSLERLFRLYGFNRAAVSARNNPDRHPVATVNAHRARVFESLLLAEWILSGGGKPLSPNTVRSYQRELVRFFLYAQYELEKPPLDVTAEDLVGYFAFVAAPSPAWIEEDERVARSAGSPSDGTYMSDQPPVTGYWRPFAQFRGRRDVSPSVAASRALSIYFQRAFRKKLVHIAPTDDIRAPAFAADRRDSVKKRLITAELWSEVCRVVEALQPASEAEFAQVARAKYVFDFLFYTAARRSDMGPLVDDDDEVIAGGRAGEIAELGGRYEFVGEREGWLLMFRGKGKKEQSIPASDALVKSWSEYRLAVGRPALPDPTLDLPYDQAVVYTLDGARPLRAASVYGVFRWLMNRVSSVLNECSQAPGVTEHRRAALKQYASKVRSISPHWVRHRALTSFVEQTGSLRAAQKLARHSNVNTTTIYVDIEGDEQRKAINQLSKS